MKPIETLPSCSDIKIVDFLSGYFMSDGGAAMGVLPKAIWQKKMDVDEKNRIKFSLRHLLIEINNKKIIIDTGIGNRLSDKEIKIYQPSPFTLISELKKHNIERDEIDYVIMTHLHFDHAGGIISHIDGEDQLTFPNAEYIIQKDEWEMAKNPDELNKAAYNFDKHLSMLENRGKIIFFDNDFTIENKIKVVKVGGHTIGMSIVEIMLENEKWIFAGDNIPNHFHLSLPVISAYDISRNDTFVSKKNIFNEADIIIFPHDDKYVAAQK